MNGDANTFRDNTISGARDHGFFLSGSDKNIVEVNTVSDSGNGFTFEGARNKVVGNTATDSSYTGFTDRSVPGSNTYEDNVCLASGEASSAPPGLCSTTPRLEGPGSED